MKKLMVLVLGTLLAQAIAAAPGGPVIPAGIQAALRQMMPNTQPDSVSVSPVSGIYEVIYGPQVFYITQDGRYALQGNLVDVEHKMDLTEARRSQGRAALINGIDPKSMIVFAPEKPKYMITIFTDVDCAYCRKLHSEIKQYMDQGITVRYLAFPRTGVNSPSYYKAVSVWCADDRKKAITQAKLGLDVPHKTCKNPVQQHMGVAERIGVEGTPTMVMEDGTVIPGYVPATQLRQMLAAHAKD